MPGVPSLREAIADKVERFTDARSIPTRSDRLRRRNRGLVSSIQAVVRPGDEVIVFDPAYDSYEPAVTLAGGITRHLPLALPAGAPGFSHRLAATAGRHHRKTRLIMSQFPAKSDRRNF